MKPYPVIENQSLLLFVHHGANKKFGPLAVVSGVIPPINGQEYMGNWGILHPTYVLSPHLGVSKNRGTPKS